MSMTRDELRALIAANPSMVALAHAEPPQTQLIADELSVGRKRLQSRQLSERGVLAALGPVAGGAFLDALDAFAVATLPGEHPLASAHSGIKRALAWLKDADGIDIGDASSQAMLAAFAALGVTEPTATATVQALGYVDDPISEFDVRCAVFNDDGSLAV